MTRNAANIDTALVFARQSPSRVTGLALLCPLPSGSASSRLGELTAKLANYERTDKISVDGSLALPLSLAVSQVQRWEPGNL